MSNFSLKYEIEGQIYFKREFRYYWSSAQACPAGQLLNKHEVLGSATLLVVGECDASAGFRL
jgi:hypothetical protein